MPKHETKRIIRQLFWRLYALNLPQAQIESMLDALVTNHWYEWYNAIPAELCLSLLDEIETFEEQGNLKPAGIGRGDEHQLASDIRRDHIKWITGTTPAQIEYLAIMNALQQEINRALFLGLFEYECHYALYNQGDFYLKHMDAFKGQANRIVTTVLYLNPDWREDWGGELLVYNEEGNQVMASINPEIGKLVVFMSENVPHEVAVTHHPRASIAGWFRLNNTNGLNLDPAR